MNRTKHRYYCYYLLYNIPDCCIFNSPTTTSWSTYTVTLFLCCPSFPAFFYLGKYTCPISEAAEYLLYPAVSPLHLSYYAITAGAGSCSVLCYVWSVKRHSSAFLYLHVLDWSCSWDGGLCVNDRGQQRSVIFERMGKWESNGGNLNASCPFLVAAVLRHPHSPSHRGFCCRLQRCMSQCWVL